MTKKAVRGQSEQIEWLQTKTVGWNFERESCCRDTMEIYLICNL